MPDLIYIISRWWKQITSVMVLSLLIIGIIIFLKPKKYLSVATAVPASSYSSDKSKVFNENIQILYSTLGTTDDLDMIVGTGKLDTVYTAVAQQFNLYDHYKMKEKGDAALRKAASILKKNTTVMKSEYGELKIKVWDTDKNLAPQLANAIMDALQAIHTQLQGAGNEATLKGLIQAKEKLKRQADSTSLSGDLKGANQNRILEYDKLISEYQMMVDNKPPVLMIVEKAKASDWPDKPKRAQILIATGVLSFLFALLAALVLERRKTVK